MKPSKNSLRVILLLGCWAAVTGQLQAQTDPCYTTYTNCTYWAGWSYSHALQSYQNNYNNSTAGYYRTLTSQEAQLQITYNNNCISTWLAWSNGMAQTAALYTADENANTAWYNGLGTNATCSDGALYDYYSGYYPNWDSFATANEWDGYYNWYGTSLGSLALAQYTWQDPAGGYLDVNALYGKNCGQASAYLDYENTMENWQSQIQWDACNYSDSNCELGRDCSANPPPALNCCQDGCAENYNTAVHNAYASYINEVAGPYPGYIYQLDMAGTTQNYNDSEAARSYAVVVDMANMTFNYNDGVNYDVEQLNLSDDGLEATYTAAMCVCGGGDAFTCWLTAQATQTTEDAAAILQYNNAHIGFVLTCSNATASAWNSYTNTLAQDANQDNSTTTKYNALINSLMGTAGTNLNNGYFAAWKGWTNCIAGCVPSQGG